jgi:hypothetical protein
MISEMDMEIDIEEEKGDINMKILTLRKDSSESIREKDLE